MRIHLGRKAGGNEVDLRVLYCFLVGQLFENLLVYSPSFLRSIGDSGLKQLTEPPNQTTLPLYNAIRNA